MNKCLIAALGNPGDEYKRTRHNVGFLVADVFASEAGAKFKTSRLAEVAQFRYRSRPVTLIKPNTFMNLSGKAVSYWMREEKILPENVLVLVDEIALPPGKIRVGAKGSNGGHNGLASIEEELGTTVYPRLRFGIGNQFPKGGQVDYVLGNFTEEEMRLIEPRLKMASEAVKTFIFAGLERCMNEFNSK